MAKLKLTSEIVDNDTKVWYSWDGFESISSDDVVKFIENISADDNDIDIRINCNGGNVFEGWRMYDALRQSGKTISATVEGMCASMATVILLAAPKERRYAYPNASFCIHNPAVCYLDVDYYSRLTADAIEAMAEKLNVQADQLRNEQQKIVDLYVERTGANADDLQKLMNEDVIIPIARAKELGFIGETLVPNTASKQTIFKSYLKPETDMNKDNAKLEVGKSWLARLIAKAGFKSQDDVVFNDIKVTAADGTEITVEREEGNPAIGDNASPDGSHVMQDGSTLVIKDGVITDVIAFVAEIKDPKTGDTLDEEQAQQKLNELQARVDELEAKLADKETETSDLNAKIVEAKTESDHKIAELETKISDIEKNVITDEQKDILGVVATAGGKEWLDKMASMQSNGQPPVPQTSVGNGGEDHVGKAYLDELEKSNKGRIRVK